MVGLNIFYFLINTTAIFSVLNGVYNTPQKTEIINNGAQKWALNKNGVFGESKGYDFGVFEKLLETKTPKKFENFMKLEKTGSELEIQNKKSIKKFPQKINFEKTKMGRKGGVELRQEINEFPAERRKTKEEETPEESCPPSRLYSSQWAEGYKKEGSIRWVPQNDKYLLMRCAYGRISNRVACYHNAVNLAGFLNRTLIFSVDKDEVSDHFDRHVSFDMNHVRECFGENTIMSTQEYMKIHKKPIVVEKILCFREQSCQTKNLTEPYGSQFFHFKSIKFLPNIRPEISPIPYPRLEQARKLLQNITENVLFMGEMYMSGIVGLSQSVLWDTPFIRSQKCKSLLSVQPHIATIEAGKNYVKEIFKNEPFMGVHLRRGDFERWCSGTENGCYRPINEIILCLKEKMRIYNLTTMFLATNTKAEELNFVTQEFTKEKKNIRIVRFGQPEKNSDWAKPLRDANLESSNLLTSILEKMICTFSTVFVGTHKSTFTADIERMRYGFETANCRDSMLCDNIEVKEA